MQHREPRFALPGVARLSNSSFTGVSEGGRWKLAETTSGWLTFQVTCNDRAQFFGEFGFELEADVGCVAEGMG